MTYGWSRAPPRTLLTQGLKSSIRWSRRRSELTGDRFICNNHTLLVNSDRKHSCHARNKSTAFQGEKNHGFADSGTGAFSGRAFDAYRCRGLAQRDHRRVGEGHWKGLYTGVSLACFALLAWGFGLARQVLLWSPPIFMRHLPWVLTLVAFILLAATYVPRNAIKARLHHPMVLGVILWALAYLLANGNLAHVLLFGSFGVWAALSFRAARARDREARMLYPIGTASGTTMALVVGIAAWFVFAFWGHGFLMGGDCKAIFRAEK